MRALEHPRNAWLAVDIGGTSLKGVVVDGLGAVIQQQTVPTFTGDSVPMESLSGLIRTLIDAATAAGAQILGIGIAVPGLVDTHRRIVTYAANLGWSDLHLGAHLEKQFGLPVAIEHDARAGSIAERALRNDSEDHVDDFIFVPIGTGIAASIVTGGHLVTGARGAAGEFGHMQVRPGGEQCACGQRGCLEAYVSATNVVRRYRAQGGVNASDAPTLIRLLPHDAIARRVWVDLIEALASGLASLSAVLDPERIIIGGGLSRAGHVLLQPLQTDLAQRLLWRTAPVLERSSLTSHAGLIGAAVIAPGFDRADARSVRRSLRDLMASPSSSLQRRTIPSIPTK